MHKKLIRTALTTIILLGTNNGLQAMEWQPNHDDPHINDHLTVQQCIEGASEYNYQSQQPATPTYEGYTDWNSAVNDN